MHDQPTRGELLSAVADFLRQDAAPALTGRVAFHAKIAANVVDIVRRELDQEARGDDGLQGQLQRLIGIDGDMPELVRTLCDRIAAEELTSETPGLMPCLWALTRHKIAVDQPRYSGNRQAASGQPLNAKAEGTA